MMRVAFGSDHRGTAVKSQLVAQLQSAGHTVEDCGPQDDQRVDYPDFAATVCQRLATGDVDRGVLICGSGIGMSIAANKMPGVRAALCFTEQMAELSRQHNDANVLCLSADLVELPTNEQILNSWMRTEFEGGRHANRVQKIMTLGGC